MNHLCDEINRSLCLRHAAYVREQGSTLGGLWMSLVLLLRR